jgi:Terpene cyclase DEP1
MKKIYLALAILGFILPMSQLVPFVREHGPDLGAFLTLPFANAVSSMFTLDLLASCAAFWAFVFASPVPRRWLYVALTLLVGLSFALPLFLYARSRDVPRHQSITQPSGVSPA